MIFELRMYHIQPGQRDAYVKRFEEEVIASQVAKGVVIVGSFVGLQDEDQFVWIRRFDSEEARERFNSTRLRTVRRDIRDDADRRESPMDSRMGKFYIPLVGSRLSGLRR